MQPGNHLYDHSYVNSVLQQHSATFVGCLLADPTPGGGGAAALEQLVTQHGYRAVRFNPYLWPQGESMANEVRQGCVLKTVAVVSYATSCLGCTPMQSCRVVAAARLQHIIVVPLINMSCVGGVPNLGGTGGARHVCSSRPPGLSSGPHALQGSAAAHR